MRLTEPISNVEFILVPAVTLRIARGTRDVTLQAMKALVDTLDARMELALKRESLTSLQLQKTLRATAEELQEALTRCKAQLLNVGSDVTPVWMWRPGTSRAEVLAVVQRLLSERPMTTKEMVELLGVKITEIHRVMGILKAKYPRDRLQNMGTSLVPRWFLIPEGTRRA